MKTTLGSDQIIQNCLINAGSYNKAARAANVKQILSVRRDLTGIRLEGSVLRIDISNGIEAEPNIHSAIEQLINGHETTLQEGKSTATGRTEKILLVDLLKPR
ncbi:MAG: hypothetical protein V1775_00220 [Bacteroidota bacterium]